jgi:hypothetical protein
MTTRPCYEQPVTYNTIQLIEAPPGYRARWKMDDGTHIYEPVIFFALTEVRTHEAMSNDRIYVEFTNGMTLAEKRSTCLNIDTEIFPVILDAEFQELTILTPRAATSNYDGVEKSA